MRSGSLELFAELMLNLFLAGRLYVDLLVSLVTPLYRGNVQDCKFIFFFIEMMVSILRYFERALRDRMNFKVDDFVINNTFSNSTDW